MSDFGFKDMQAIQAELQEKYIDKWGGLSPEKGRETLLWMIIEAGEAADIIKKDGDEKIVKDEKIRNHFIEEICDVFMYLNDVMLCYSITPEELEKIYVDKHQKNMKRW
ncbi:nucleotide pyrophosphohydrolase [Anaerocolumna sp. AGMB13025]|uniref:nucleotide pyrophosphohydrolase n=1 Tax=Anaerocolumna sp. AGMB13025 TaxID=3039116 RepID=UPI00241CC197|nr:nucleotide pyrophosphohydrolase [Anaerocolumna sp. AGMB13025]WFR57238.1 nucleotide pyrophosphohydrolase [Anaerocolumna sp. AGMB13025]